MTFFCYTVKKCRTLKTQPYFSWQTKLQHFTMICHNKKTKKIAIGEKKFFRM